jgi:hypothetical protein
MHDDIEALTAAALARLAETRSARFVAWLSVGEAEPGDAELWASGTTDFGALETRTRQRPIPPSRMRDLKDHNREPNPFFRAAVKGFVWWLGRSGESTDFQDLYYTAGRAWKQSSPDTWRLRHRAAPSRPGLRAALDPTLVLEAIPALSISDVRRAVHLHGCLTELVEGRADLRRVEDRLQEFFDVGLSRSRAQGWYESAPIRLWIDTTGLVRRISYSPLPPNPRDQPCWWTTLELSAFGTPVERPDYFEMPPTSRRRGEPQT